MQIARLLSGFVLLSSLLLQSCQQEPLRITAEEEYIREFYKTFKNVDPDHDWNLAQKSTVTVKTSVPSSIRVLADVKGTRYLFADYKDAQGTTEIPVTLPKGVSDIIVSVNGQKFPSTLGATVDATSAKSRIINGSEVNFTTEDALEWKIEPETVFATVAMQDYLATYGEDDPKNLSKGTNSFYILSDGEEHTFFPFYWQTNKNHCLGIYVVDDNDESKITIHDLYYSKSGELFVSTDHRPELKERERKVGVEMLFRDFKGNTIPDDIKPANNFDAKDWEKTVFPGLTWSDNITKYYTAESAIFKTEHGYISRITHFCIDYTTFYRFFETPTEEYTEKVNQEYVEGTWVRANKDKSYSSGPETYVKTRGITYKLPAGKRYGFYIKALTDVPTDYNGFEPQNAKYSFIVFSNAKQNQVPFYDPITNEDKNETIRNTSWKDMNWWATSGASELDKYAYASWGKAQMDGLKYTMFGFEDWPAKSPEGQLNDIGADLNDIMFLFEAGEEPTGIVDTKDPDPTPEEPKPYTWIIAAEDLGGSFDWDFNDLVAEIQLLPVSENDKKYTRVTVKPLASGGFRPVYLMYTGKTYDVKNDTKTAVKDYVVGGEFHTLFRGSHGNPINVSKGQKRTADEIMFYTPEGHTMAKQHEHYNGENMGGFWVLSCEENKPLSGITTTNGLQHLPTIPEGHGINQVGAPKYDKELTSPQIMCLEAGWRWPLENKDIRHAYTTFESWVTDATKTEWVNTYDEEHLIDKY